MDASLPALVVVVPMLAAILTALAGRWWRRHAWPVALLATAFAAAGSLRILWRAVHEGVVLYRMGGWPVPTGIPYRIDLLNGIVLAMVACVSFLSVLWMRESVKREIRQAGQASYYAVVLLFTTGFLGITITGDVFNLYVFLEIASITSYVLVAMGRRREGLFAGYQYLILGSIGATFVLIGIGHLYMATGSLAMTDIAARLSGALVDHPSVVHTSFAFITVGLAIKMALFPLHSWQPGAYTYAPSSASLLMAATATKVAAYAFYRFAFTVFGTHYVTARLPQVMDGIMVMAAAAMVVGPLFAVRQDNLKRMLAYSSVGQIGYVVLGAALVNASAMTGSIAHFWNHAASKGALFAVVGIVVLRSGSPHIDNLRGLGRRAPWTAAAMTVAALSLVGVPLTGGFVTKYYLGLGTLETGRGVLLAFILLSSLLTAVYMWRCLQRVWFADPDLEPAVTREAPWTMRVATLTFGAACLVFGVFAWIPVDIASAAARALLGGN